jgi:hypothetical protein
MENHLGTGTGKAEKKMFDQETIAEITGTARSLAIEPAALLAIAEVESGGQAFATVGGRREPPIRFEGHYFDRRLSGETRDRARAEGLASPVPGAVANPGSQAARWKMLERATEIDRDAALESVSWGLGQVMGAHWAWLGFDSAAALVAEARAGIAGQVRLMARYIVKSGLAAALRAHDWAAFARGYNGPDYVRHGYDRKLAAAYRRHAVARSRGAGAPAPMRHGSTGEAVFQLQRDLVALGYQIDADGIFGPATETAVRRFQADCDLATDGIAGSKTVAALAALCGEARGKQHQSEQEYERRAAEFDGRVDAAAKPSVPGEIDRPVLGGDGQHRQHRDGNGGTERHRQYGKDPARPQAVEQGEGEHDQGA